jgi:uncharacterized protein
MQPITYSLKAKDGNQGTFYLDVRRVTNIVLMKANDKLRNEVEDYQDFIYRTGAEKCRSYNEYLLELILLGVLWKSNEANARKTSMMTTKVLHQLFLLRKKNARLKPTVDKLRGMMISSSLFHDSELHSLEFRLASLYRLLNWLDATGEYAEEVKRLNGWLRYAESIDEQGIQELISKTYDFAGFFTKTCSEILGPYTKEVNTFVNKARETYKYREDYALATRSEAEYHLNMVGAEILNKALKDRFVRAQRKIVLLPTCMRSRPAEECRAISRGPERKCTACNSECNIGKTCSQLSKVGMETYLIPHSSDFSRFLKYWKDEPDVALVGVACVLNLMMGGYEMLNLGIASQCVYLDHCGCKKHWDKEGVPTSISIDQLLEISGIPGVSREKETFQINASVHRVA